MGQTWREYHWDCLKHFGIDCYKGGILGLISTIFAAFVTYFLKISRDTGAGDAFRDSLQVALVILWIFTAFYLLRTPWHVQNRLSLLSGNLKASFGFVGIVMTFYLGFGVGYLAYEKWLPKKHRSAISARNPDYPYFYQYLEHFSGSSKPLIEQKVLTSPHSTT